VGRAIAVVFLFVACGVHAGEREAASELVLGYFGALKNGEFEKAPSYFHASELRELQKAFAKLAKNDRDRAAIASATPEEAFRIVLDKVMFRLTESDLRATFGDVAIIGEVQEGDSMWHVVYRQTGTMRGAAVSGVDIMTASKQGSVWRLSLPSDIRGAIQIANNPPNAR
jgi:hypothetical protein